MGDAHIAKMPRLMGNAGDGLLSRGVPEHKAKIGGTAAEGAADAVRGKVGADEVNFIGGKSQVDGKPRLVLAASRQRHVLSRKGFPGLDEAVVPDGLLLCLTAPAGDRYDLPLTTYGLDACAKEPGDPALQQHIGIALVHRRQIRPWLLRQGMCRVDQQQGIEAALGSPHTLSHAPSTSSSMSRVMRAGKSSPVAAIIRG